MGSDRIRSIRWILSLQWSQVRGDLFLPAGKKKAKKPRRVPISPVLKAARRADSRSRAPR